MGDLALFIGDGVRAFSSQAETAAGLFKALLIFRRALFIQLDGKDPLRHLHNGDLFFLLKKAVSRIQAYEAGTDDHNLLRCPGFLIDGFRVA